MIPIERAHLYVEATTHAGMKGKDNEDRYAVSAFRTSRKDSTPSVLAVVADGVGGHQAGEVAAEMAVEIISETVSRSTARQPDLILKEAVLQASQSIYMQAQTHPAYQGMSSTCACVWVIDDRLYTATVGDSRIYLVRGDIIRQLSTDHTWVQEAIDEGVLTPEQARNHPNAHVIRRHLGSAKPVIPDLRLRLNPGETDDQAQANQGLHLQPGDQIILCTDGLTDLVEDLEILNILRSTRDNGNLEKLVAIANSRGGHDNITILDLRMPLKKGALMRLTKPGNRSPVGWFLLGMSSFVLVGLLLVGGLVWLKKGPSPTPTEGRETVTTLLSIPEVKATFTPTTGITASATIIQTGTNLTPTDISPTASPTRVAPTYTPWPTSTQIPALKFLSTQPKP